MCEGVDGEMDGEEKTRCGCKSTQINRVCRPPEDTKQDEFVKEVQALKSLHHPKLIQLLAMCSRGEPVYIVTELMSKGSLKSYLTCESSNAPLCSVVSAAWPCSDVHQEA